VAVDPAFGPRLSRTSGNGAAERYGPALGYDAGSSYGRAVGPPGMLAADADRERAIDALKAGFAEGRLTRAEYDDRTARVYAARFYGQLVTLTADLPAGPFVSPAHYLGIEYLPRQTALPDTNSMAVAALACGIGAFPTLGLTAIPAIIFGWTAQRQVRQTGQRGGGMALAGLILGWIGLIAAIIIAGLIVATLVSRHSGQGAAVPAAPGGSSGQGGVVHAVPGAPSGQGG
jgi:uncharacterized membrane protein